MKSQPAMVRPHNQNPAAKSHWGSGWRSSSSLSPECLKTNPATVKKIRLHLNRTMDKSQSQDREVSPPPSQKQLLKRPVNKGQEDLTYRASYVLILTTESKAGSAVIGSPWGNSSAYSRQNQGARRTFWYDQDSAASKEDDLVDGGMPWQRLAEASVNFRQIHS